MFRGGHARVVRHTLVLQVGAMISGAAITVEPPCVFQPSVIAPGVDSADRHLGTVDHHAVERAIAVGLCGRPSILQSTCARAVAIWSGRSGQVCQLYRSNFTSNV